MGEAGAIRRNWFGRARPDYFFGTLPTPSSLTLLSGPDSRLVSIVNMPLYFCAAVGVKVTETSQLPAGMCLPLGRGPCRRRPG